MKKIIALIVCIYITTTASAQIDTIPKTSGDTSLTNTNNDTVRVAGVIIINHHDKKKKEVEITIGKKEKRKVSNVKTSWWLFDIGFANYIDKTDYSLGGSYLVNRPGYPALGEDDFKLKAGKSVNVNIWFFMQRLNLINHQLNLKYGLGLELNNYRYVSNISYKQGGNIPYTNPAVYANYPFVFRDSISFTKNKLAADYLTVPIMLNFTSNPRNPKKSFLLSGGISAGYLYSQRNKQKSAERGKQKNKGDYDLEQFKISAIGEIGLGPVVLYGSYSPASMYQKTLNIKPFTLGIRLNNL